jgi:hypothetical protein
MGYPAVNNRFMYLARHIEDNLSERSKKKHIARLAANGVRCSSKDIDMYAKGEYKTLKAACQKHRREFARPLTTPEVIVLVHPFYLTLSHMSEISARQQAEAAVYLDDLTLLLDTAQQTKAIDVVVLETAHHYAAATSNYLEQGAVTDVIFTQFDSGDPLKINDLRKLRSKVIYIGGGYDGRCLGSALINLDYIVGNANTYAITGLTLRSPRDSDGGLFVTDGKVSMGPCEELANPPVFVDDLIDSMCKQVDKPYKCDNTLGFKAAPVV